ncbi:MAG: acylphosphatase [Pseudomonadota bacterium]
MSLEEKKTVKVLISGRVQGVGFRYWVLRQAEARGLSGWVRNLGNGDVEALISGPPEVVADMLTHFWQGPSFSKVKNVVSEAAAPPARVGFEIWR